MERSEGGTWGSKLEELGYSHYQVANGEPDIRGWKIYSGQGEMIGKVKELLCEAKARKVRYMVVDLEGNHLDLEPRDVLIPIGLAEINLSTEAVIVQEVSFQQLQALPAYDRDHLTLEAETLVQRIFVGDYVYRPGAGIASKEGLRHQDTNPTHLQRNSQPQHVIGLFTTPEEANQKLEQLTAQGFSRDQLEVAMRQSVNPQTGYSPADFEVFFRQLFSTKEEADQNYEKFRQSNALVVVQAYSTEEAYKAAGLLDTSRSAEKEVWDEPVKSSQMTTPAVTSTSEPLPAPFQENNRNMSEKEVEIKVVQQHKPLPEIPREENTHVGQEASQTAQGPSSGPEFGSFQEGSLELKELAEIPIVSKQPHVVEEINIGKEVEEREETVKDSVKRTEIEIEEIRKEQPPQSPPPSLL